MINKNTIIIFFPQHELHIYLKWATFTFEEWLCKGRLLGHDWSTTHYSPKPHPQKYYQKTSCQWLTGRGRLWLGKKGRPAAPSVTVYKVYGCLSQKEMISKETLITVTSGIMNSLWMVFSTNRLQNFKPPGTVEMSLNNQIIWDKKTRYPLSS